MRRGKHKNRSTYSFVFSSKSTSRSAMYVSSAEILGVPHTRSCSIGGTVSEKSTQLVMLTNVLLLITQIMYFLLLLKISVDIVRILNTTLDCLVFK